MWYAQNKFISILTDAAKNVRIHRLRAYLNYICFRLETETELVSLEMQSCSTLYIFDRYKVHLSDCFDLNQIKCQAHSHFQ